MRGGSLASKRNMGKVGAILFAAGLPLGLFAGSAYAGGWDDGSGSLDNTSSADAYVDQWTSVHTDQDASANTGHNKALSGVWGENQTDQDADASASDGNISAEDADDAQAGNEGGQADNKADSKNDGTSKAEIGTGPASAKNTAETTVIQDNSGGAQSDQKVGQTDIDIDGDGTIDNSSSAYLSVQQGAKVSTSQNAYANSGGNFAASGVGGSNWTGQSANASASGGDIDGGYKSDADGAQTGNNGGTATNGSLSSNNGNSTAAISTGDATASNTSSTNVTQTNSGGASSNQTVGQEDIDLG
jgi:hypothetical protein